MAITPFTRRVIVTIGALLALACNENRLEPSAATPTALRASAIAGQ